ncbi:MAG: hypothetical protein ACPGUC_11745, partial [Gammaproteobacteria bacterium]
MFSDYAQWFMFAPGLVIALASGDLLVDVSGYVPVWLFQAQISMGLERAISEQAGKELHAGIWRG